MAPVVALQACAEYAPEAVEAAVRNLFESLGGLGRFVRGGDRVFLKVNMLTPSAPELAISTHPEVVRAVAREVKRLGARPMVGDNPAMAKPSTALRKCGIQAVIDELGIEAPDLAPVAELESPEGVAFRHFQVSKAILEADVLINLPKLKTHSLTYMTVAMKNLFGLVPGTEKARWHARSPDARAFASMVVDLYAGARRHFSGPRRILHLCDGVLGMEGEGPGRSGTPRKLGALLASEDAVALDRLACALVGLDPERLLIVKEAARRGLGEGELSRIATVGELVERWAGPGFAPPAGATGRTGLGQRLARSTWVRNRLVERPELEPSRCISCRKCAQICPVKAISMVGEKPKPQPALDTCIRCYCCAEICPEGALHKSATPWLGRLLAV